MARSQGRKFVWARSSGVYTPGEASGPGANLLADVQARSGPGVFIGATVMTVRGFIRPNVPDASFVRGVFGIRVCDEADVEGGTQNDHGPDAQPEADWMAFMPWAVSTLTADSGSVPAASWNEMSSPWALEIKSNRRMEELAQTLGLFFNTGILGTGDVTTVDWHLSVGLKLP